MNHETLDEQHLFNNHIIILVIHEVIVIHVGDKRVSALFFLCIKKGAVLAPYLLETWFSFLNIAIISLAVVNTTLSLSDNLACMYHSSVSFVLCHSLFHSFRLSTNCLAIFSSCLVGFSIETVHTKDSGHISLTD